MAKTGIFYGSATGVTAGVARKIAAALGVAAEDVYDVAKTAPSALGDYELLVLGSSTWGSGELEDDWYDFIEGAEVLDLKGKKIAVFGCGDETMSDTFCSAVGEIYKRMKATGAELVGQYNAEGYDFEHSDADLGDGLYAGLLLDEVNHEDLTPGRIEAWSRLVRESA